ncbi:hypothetical protein AB0E88_12295 [Streptomyces sp. NPDC028635]|uniref:hypothetical protein n=1 Tax=Streptomyces sp. NPDC028635 TaxID=3154800 RepID=UPI00340B6B0E
MMEQQDTSTARCARQVRVRRAGIAAFLVGTCGALVFFAFFPGLPHVIDWGAILVSLGVGILSRWGVQVWVKGRG